MAFQIDIPLRRNEDWAREWLITDGAGNAVDLTGWTAALQVKSRLNNSAVVASALIDIEPEAGRITTVLRASEGHPLQSFGSPVQTENLPFDFRLTDPSGLKVDVAAGVVILSRGVTLNG